MIQNPSQHSKGCFLHYGQWIGDKPPSAKQRMRLAIIAALEKKPADFAAFLRLMEESGFAVKRGRGGVVSFLAPGNDKYTRLWASTLGAGFDPEDIREVIAGERPLPELPKDAPPPLKKSQSHRLNDQIAAKEKELTKITRYKQSLYRDWKDGEITQQEYREMKADYERQVAELSDLLARLTAERKELASGVDQQHPALVAFANYQNIEKLTREILIELVDHIKVYENGNISVKFKFADEFRRIAEYIEINTTDTAEAG